MTNVATSAPETGTITRAAIRLAPRVRWISLGLILLSLVLVARRLPVEAAIAALQSRIEGMGALGPVAFGLIYIVAVVVVFPASALTLAGGAIFGLGIGTLTVSISSTIGAALAFLISRYVAREAVARKVEGYPRFRAIDRAISEGGWKIVAMLRLSPVVPFNLQNYLYGLTGIGFWTCVLTSWVAMLPGTFMYVYFGYIAREGARAATVGATAPAAETALKWIVRIAGLLATVGVTMYVTRIARRAIGEAGVAGAVSEGAAGSVEPAGESGTSGWPWGATILLFAALAAAGSAIILLLDPAPLDRLAARFGPPRVVMEEAYAAVPARADFDHSTLDGLLNRHVDADGWVDYEGLRDEVAVLDGYIASLGRAPVEKLGRDGRLALLINAYNAFTLRLILDHYPIGSIMDIPAADRWEAVRWNVGGNTWSLNQIEHEQIRPRFAEPRIHFALVCAAVGCPKLRNEAYDPGRLEAQLEDQARYIHTHDRWFRYTPGEGGGTVRLTMLYNPGWYGGDFDQAAGSVLAFAARYSADLRKTLDRGEQPAVEWIAYDWSLNSLPNRR